MANILVGETENFKIWYDPTLLATNPEVVVNATTLMSSVEHDFTILGSWFGINDGFGPGNRINVNLAYSGNSGSNNGGYKPDQTSQMNLNGAPSVTPVADVVRMHFVNELVEIFMSYNNQHGGGVWNAGDSNGEGLSHFCGNYIAPAGHASFYGVALENPWMTSTRSGQYITGSPENTDKDTLSYGPATLFLFYLYSQLGYSPKAIVQANGSTLAQTYQTLTGKTDAFGPFLALLNDFFPSGNPDATANQLRVANPFPLLYSEGRSVSLSAAEQDTGAPIRLSAGSAMVSPFFTCPKAKYGYTVLGQPVQIVVNAKTHGFGQASFAWTINGQPLGGAPIAEVTETGPDIGGGTLVEPLALSYAWKINSPDRLTEQLTLTLNDPFGTYDLTIGCTATEMFAKADAERTTITVPVDNRSTQWDRNYYADQHRCSSHVRGIIDRYVNVHVPFLVALTAPDPPPQYKQAVDTLRSAAQALAVLDNMPAEHRGIVEKVVKQSLGVSATALRRLAGSTPRTTSAVKKTAAGTS